MVWVLHEVLPRTLSDPHQRAIYHILVRLCGVGTPVHISSVIRNAKHIADSAVTDQAGTWNVIAADET